MALKSSALADTGQQSLLRLSLLILSWIIPLSLLFCLQSRDILHLRMTWGPPPGLSLRIWGTKVVFGRTALWGWGVERWYHNQAIPDSSRTTGSTGKVCPHSLPTLLHRAPSSHRRGPDTSAPLSSCPHKTACHKSHTSCALVTCRLFADQTFYYFQDSFFKLQSPSHVSEVITKHSVALAFPASSLPAKCLWGTPRGSFPLLTGGVLTVFSPDWSPQPAATADPAIVLHLWWGLQCLCKRYS